MEELGLNDVLTAEEVADYLKVPVKDIHLFCRQGRLRYCQITPRKRRFTREMVLDFVKSNIGGNIPVIKTVPDESETVRPRRIASTRKGGITKKSDSGTSVRAQLIQEMRSW